MSASDRRATARKHIDKKLLIRLRIFFAISIILLVIAVYEVIAQNIGILWALAGLVIGTIVGILSSRMMITEWNHEAQKVATRMDILGGIILALYIIFAVSRNWIFGHWLEGSALGAFGFIVLAGAIGTRFIAMGISVRDILHDEGILLRK